MMISASRRIDSNVSLVLVAGFALVIVLLLTAGYLGIQAMEGAEEEAVDLQRQLQTSNRLIDDIQGQEASLGSLFYNLVGSRSPGRDKLLSDLAPIEAGVRRTLDSALAREDGRRWSAVKVAFEDFLDEMRRALDLPQPTSKFPDSLFDSHERLVSELSLLVASNYEGSLRVQRQTIDHGRQLLRQAIIALGVALILAIATAAGTVYTSAQRFRRMNWQARELSRLSNHVLETQEAVVRRFSQELHDELGQTLTAIEATLTALPNPTHDQRDRIEDCQLLIKDAISSIREMSQLLRPSMLDDFGLCPSLQTLSESFTQRTGIEVRTRLVFDERLPEMTETHLFRLAQEALTNVARHSGATAADLSLERVNDRLVLMIQDNGRGIAAGGRPAGFGLIGMRERTLAINGDLDIVSNAQGVTIRVEAPVGRTETLEAAPRHAGGRPQSGLSRIPADPLP